MSPCSGTPLWQLSPGVGCGHRCKFAVPHGPPKDGFVPEARHRVCGVVKAERHIVGLGGKGTVRTLASSPPPRGVSSADATRQPPPDV